MTYQAYTNFGMACWEYLAVQLQAFCGQTQGFVEVVAGPMVRSSYRAEQVLQKNNVGLAV